jgi:hypothetical protein
MHFGAIDDEFPETTSCSFVNKGEFQELENFSDLSVLTEEFDPGSD